MAQTQKGPEGRRARNKQKMNRLEVALAAALGNVVSVGISFGICGLQRG